MTKKQEKDYVRELARQVAEIADRSDMERRRQRWRDAYMLRTPDRVPVWCNPNGCRSELQPEDDLKCRNAFYRSVEKELRWILIRDELNDDAVFNPYWRVPAAVECENPPVWGVEVKRIRPAAERGAWAYDPPIKDESDLDELVMPTWRHNEEKTRQRLGEAEEIFDGIMPVKLMARCPLSASLAHVAGGLVGLDALMLNMAAQPNMIHRLMAFLRDGVLRTMDDIESMGILTENTDEQIHFSESLKTSPSNVPVKFSDLWCRTESQAFEHVSPAMWQEFLLDYQMPILTRYRYVSYGCCENLTRKIDGVLSIPNLRIFVNGPWTELKTSAEKCRGRACIVWRQKATDVIFAPDLRAVRQHLEKGLRTTRGCNRVIVLQEIMTTNGNPARLAEWVHVAKEASEAFR